MADFIVINDMKYKLYNDENSEVDKLLLQIIKAQAYKNLTNVNGDDIFVKLSEAGYAANEKDAFGNTVLHLAANNNRVDIIKMLISIGAPLDAHGQFGYAPLHLAAYRGHTESIKILIEAGASVNAMNDGGLVAFDVARNQYEKDTTNKAKFEGIKLLIAAGSITNNPAYVTAYPAIEISREIAQFNKNPIKYVLMNNKDSELAFKALENVES